MSGEKFCRGCGRSSVTFNHGALAAGECVRERGPLRGEAGAWSWFPDSGCLACRGSAVLAQLGLHGAVCSREAV